jgi:hypothetical protein
MRHDKHCALADAVLGTLLQLPDDEQLELPKVLLGRR